MEAYYASSLPGTHFFMFARNILNFGKKVSAGSRLTLEIFERPA
jgi:hypothetical protein